ncbi:unnamed protein product [Mytilus coruscus]|uniref:HECT domain-containing protein n=1 Tax=Mytilus coruscus TaxID=42192 RepID=A0A6J8DZJ8_MYTCO|nr:unnamed protein product [Mytilus coruscus]
MEEPRQFIKDLRKGLDSLRFYQLVRSLPSLVHLFTPFPPTPITFKKITTLLKPEFSADGSNRMKAEKKVYSKFLKYLREAATKVLKFATSVEEEPILGFTLHPSLHFSERKSHLPTGNTCINQLMLTIPENGEKLPEDDVLFNFFDYAFCNAYYGLQ